MVPKKVIGLDLSITCTGVAGDGWAEIIPTPGYVKKKKSDPIQEERNRLANHHERLTTILNLIGDYTRNADLVVMEGLAFDSKDFDRQNAGLAWMVRHHLHRAGIAYALVPPPNLKMYATGNGAASKDDVVRAVRLWFPELGTLDNNAADAAVLAAMGRDHLELPLGTVTPQRRIQAMGGATWPLLVSDGAVLAVAA